MANESPATCYMIASTRQLESPNWLSSESYVTVLLLLDCAVCGYWPQLTRTAVRSRAEIQLSVMAGVKNDSFSRPMGSLDMDGAAVIIGTERPYHTRPSACRRWIP